MQEVVLPELEFSVAGAEALTRSTVPTVGLRLAVARTGGPVVRSATVGVRVDIATARRAYDEETEARLVELFGEPERWGSTLRGLGWVRTTVLVGAVEDVTTVEVPLPGTYDFDVAAAKYLHALRDGEIPLDLMFTGTVLYEAGGRLGAAPIPWDRQASYRLPVAVWRDAMDSAFPNSAWLRLDRDTFDRLYAFKAERGLTSWEATVDALLAGQEEPWTA